MSPAEILPFAGRQHDPAPNARRRQRIAFVINSLGLGGAERVMNTILHTASPAEWDIHLVLLDREQEARSPPAFVTVHRLNCRWKLLPSVQQLTQTLKAIRPDLIVSFLVRANVASVIAGRRLNTPVVISERSNLSAHLTGRYRGIKRWAAAMPSRLAYSMADLVIACSEGVGRDLISRFGVDAERVETIPNPFDLDQIARDAREPADLPLPRHFMVSVGRLVEAKGFSDLIEAYAAANPEIPLCILGEGPHRRQLEEQVRRLELKDRVLLPGYSKNPFAILARAEFYVSASHCEGFPNSLAEAMAIGLPVISTDCPSGPAEILAGVETTGTTAALQAQYGILVPVGDVAAIASALAMMTDASVRSRYSGLSRIRMQAFHVRKITERYWATFRQILDDRSSVTKMRARARGGARRQA